MVWLFQTHGERNQPERRYFMTVAGYLNVEVFTMVLSDFLGIDIWSTLVLSAFFAV